MKALLFILLFSSTSLSLHEIHVSKCLIKYHEETAAIQISMHIFLDDLENALRSLGGKNLNICTGKEKDDAEDFIIAYVANQFEIKQDGITLTPDYIGKEISEDLEAVWIYLEIPEVTAKGTLEIRNEILLDLFDDQRNITSVKLPSSKEYFLFQKGESIEKLSF